MDMLSAVSKYILGFHKFGTEDMRTGVIPFELPEGYCLTKLEKSILDRLHVAPTDDTAANNELNKNRIGAMAGRAKAMIVRLFEDVANFAKNPNERSNLTNALILGLSSGIDRGRELLMYRFDKNKEVYCHIWRSLMRERVPDPDLPAIVK